MHILLFKAGGLALPAFEAVLLQLVWFIVSSVKNERIDIKWQGKK